MTEYITIKEHPELIGKRARFVEDPRYTKKCWGKKGTIVQHEGLEHVGLSLKFDISLDNNTGMAVQSLYIMPGSIELLR